MSSSSYSPAPRRSFSIIDATVKIREVIDKLKGLGLAPGRVSQRELGDTVLSLRRRWPKDVKTRADGSDAEAV
jgi:hypothetical protein